MLSRATVLRYLPMARPRDPWLMIKPGDAEPLRSNTKKKSILRKFLML